MCTEVVEVREWLGRSAFFLGDFFKFPWLARGSRQGPGG